jgi:hypothetical protein
MTIIIVINARRQDLEGLQLAGVDDARLGVRADVDPGLHAKVPSQHREDAAPTEFVGLLRHELDDERGVCTRPQAA